MPTEHDDRLSLICQLSELVAGAGNGYALRSSAILLIWAIADTSDACYVAVTKDLAPLLSALRKKPELLAALLVGGYIRDNPPPVEEAAPAAPEGPAA